MGWIEAIALAILKWLEGLSRKDTKAEDAKPQPELKRRLLDRIARHEQRVRDKGDPGS